MALGVDAWGGSWAKAWNLSWTGEPARKLGGTRRQIADRSRADELLVHEIERAFTEPKTVEPKQRVVPPSRAPVPAEERFSPLDPLEPSQELTAMALAFRKAQEKTNAVIGTAIKSAVDQSEEEMKMILLLLA